MGRLLGEDQIRKVRESVDIVQLISEYVPTQRSGANYKCCCLFHQERTPSMMIYTHDNSYHCFGCGAHGDVITLVREKENLDFNDTMELLARRAKISLEWQETGGGERISKGEREKLLEIMDRATRFYEHLLWNAAEGAEARAYLASRGLGEEVSKRFRLGWAPGRGRLVQAARKQGIDPVLLARLDLAIDRDGSWADRYYERISFPICNRFGQPIAFSARLLPAAERAAKEAGRGVGKYVNSTDTPLYHKSSVVFNLHQARKVCREVGRVIVMEGPTDVMAASQAGFHECVAVLGTALTEQHARQLGNLVGGKGDLVLLFDGDEAGRTNSLKAVRTCLSCGVPTVAATIPDDEDPGELLAEADETCRQAFEKVLASRRRDIAHLLFTIAPRPHELDQRQRLEAADQVLECLRSIQDRQLRDGYLMETASHLDIPVDRLMQRLPQAGRPDRRESESTNPLVAGVGPSLSADLASLLSLLVCHPGLREDAFERLGIEPSHFPPPWRSVALVLIERPEAGLQALLSLSDLIADPSIHEAFLEWQRAWSEQRLETDPEKARQQVMEIAEALHLSREHEATRRQRMALRQSDAGHDEMKRLFDASMARQQEVNARKDRPLASEGSEPPSG